MFVIHIYPFVSSGATTLNCLPITECLNYRGQQFTAFTVHPVTFSRLARLFSIPLGKPTSLNGLMQFFKATTDAIADFLYIALANLADVLPRTVTKSCYLRVLITRATE